MTSNPPLSLVRDRRADFLEALAQTGNVTEACEHSGLSRASAYRLRRSDDAFASAWAEAREIGIDALEDEAVRRASQGIEEEVFYGGKPVGTQRKYSDGLLQFLLKTRRPDRFGAAAARADLAPSGNDAGFRVILRDEEGNEIQPEPPADD